MGFTPALGSLFRYRLIKDIEMNSDKHVLVTGGAGYIGSHTCIGLLEAGYQVSILDNFSNSEPGMIKRIQEISGKSVAIFKADIRDAGALDRIMRDNDFFSVMHFAGLKSVSESLENPAKYHNVNVIGTQTLLGAMDRHDIESIIFSSSATVYSGTDGTPIAETCELSPPSPYGETKVICEGIIKSYVSSSMKRAAILLRYFNPVGSHQCGLIGERPKGIPENLMPIILEVATGSRERLSVFGDDYDTPDGTGMRDYIHVVDLAAGHIRALERIEKFKGVDVFNLGTGTGYSVLEMIDVFERTTGVTIPYELTARRRGDLGAVIANPQKARDILGWESNLSLSDMCKDSWMWQQTLSQLDF